MKNHLIYIFLLCSVSVVTQNIYTGNVTFNSQQSVDTFAQQNYTEVTGTILVWFGNDISNLSGLNTIESVGGYIHIADGSNLTSLSGFENIHTLGSLILKDCDLIENLDIFSNLLNFSGSLILHHNDLLENIDGLSGISTGYEDIDIRNNQRLVSLEGLSSITGLTGFLRIFNNSQLTSLIGLENIDALGVGVTDSPDGGPYTGFDASLIVKNNTILEDCCILNTSIETAPSLVIIENNAGGCNTLIEIEDSISECAIDISYPKDGDVYVAGKNIRVEFNVVPVLDNIDFNLEYSTDMGVTWIQSANVETISTTNSNDSIGFYWDSNIGISLPTSIQIRLNANIENYSIQEYSGIFTLHPSNHYSSDGFMDNGISEIQFPLDGSWGEITIFGLPYTDLFSETHNCLDEYSRDYYASDNWHSNSCNRLVKSPIKGKVVFIEKSYSPICTEYDTSIGGYGNQIVIQSDIDKTFAFSVAHLNSVASNLKVGSIVLVGQEIGLVGGTSHQEHPHAHCSLYKNIYTWFPIIENGKKTTSTVIEMISGGNTFIDNSYTNECNYIKDESSAQFIFINGNIDNVDALVGILILGIDDLTDFFNNAYTSVLSYLTIDATSSRNVNSTSIDSIEQLISLRVVEGNLTIKGTNITSLEGLNNLAYVGGDLIIENNTNLDNFCAIKVLLENNGLIGNLVVNGNLFNPQDLADIENHSDCSSVLSTIEINSTNVIAYPNPTNGIIHLKNHNNLTNVSVYNVIGRKITNGIIIRGNYINITHLKSGFYIISLKKEDKIENIKIYKQ